ncbi:MAG: oxidoreductase, partial [Bacteroidetes bacterium]
MTRTFTLPLAEVIRETPDAVTLVMNQPAVDRVSYYAGQYLTFRLDLKGEVHYRSYSLSSTPRLDRHLAVTVRSVPGGLVSPHLVQHAR